MKLNGNIMKHKILITVFICAVVVILGILFAFSKVRDKITDIKVSKNNEVTVNYLQLYQVENANVKKLGIYTGLNYSNSTMDEGNIFEVEDTYYLLKEIIHSSEFDIDEKEIAKYSVDIVNNYQELAYLHDMELEDYYKEVLHYRNKEEFFDSCYDMGLYDIQKILVVGKISDAEGIIVNENDIVSFLKKKEVSQKEYEQNEEVRDRMNYQILEEKVINYLKENNDICGY